MLATEEKLRELAKNDKDYESKLKKLLDSRNDYAKIDSFVPTPGATTREQALKSAKNEAHKKQINSLFDKAGKEAAIINPIGTKWSAGTYGHELGHLHNFIDKDANVVGRTAHKLYNISRHPGTVGADLAMGVASGIHAAKKELKGEKESKLERVAGDLGTVALQSPRLVSEAAASLHSKKLLKQHGLERYGKSLAPAFGTYAAMAGLHVAANELGRGIAKKAYLKNHKSEEEKGE